MSENNKKPEDLNKLMSKFPLVVNESMPASKALAIMSEKQITSLLVVSDKDLKRKERESVVSDSNEVEKVTEEKKKEEGKEEEKEKEKEGGGEESKESKKEENKEENVDRGTLNTKSQDVKQVKQESEITEKNKEVELDKGLMEPKTDQGKTTLKGPIITGETIDLRKNQKVTVNNEANDLEANKVAYVNSVDVTNRYVSEFPITAGFSDSIYA